jgi:hypothetical protein
LNPLLYLAGVVAIVGVLCWSLFAIYSTVVPALPKIQAALQGRGGLDG